MSCSDDNKCPEGKECFVPSCMGDLCSRSVQPICLTGSPNKLIFKK